MTKHPNIILGAVGLGRGGIWVIRKQPKPRRKLADRTCCLYPWPDKDGIAGGPYYPPEDLPSPITLNGGGSFVLTQTAGTYHYSDGSNILESESGGTTWICTPRFADGNYRSHCLIGNSSAEWIPDFVDPSSGISIDYPFSSSYAVNYPAGLTATIDIFSNCGFSGIADNGDELNLFYTLNVILYGTPPNRKPAWVLSINGNPYIKDDPQDGPVGTYTFGSDTATIS